jgi:hypothetical protein
MSKSRKATQNANPPASAAAGRRIPGLAAVVLAVGVVAVVGLGWHLWQQADAPPAATPAPEVNATNQPVPATAPSPGFEMLKGKWLRPDGGYVVEIRSVEPGGKMDATYSNPRPIHVEKAEASKDGGAVKLFIELQDVNYPGSTYNLAYDAQSDQLMGIYYQAVLQQRFEVVFVRLK